MICEGSERSSERRERADADAEALRSAAHSVSARSLTPSLLLAPSPSHPTSPPSFNSHSQRRHQEQLYCLVLPIKVHSSSLFSVRTKHPTGNQTDAGSSSIETPLFVEISSLRCSGSGVLFWAGSVARRLFRCGRLQFYFIYRNLPLLTNIQSSQDSHEGPAPGLHYRRYTMSPLRRSCSMLTCRWVF